jgi:hypothetical protein
MKTKHIQKYEALKWLFHKTNNNKRKRVAMTRAGRQRSLLSLCDVQREKE